MALLAFSSNILSPDSLAERRLLQLSPNQALNSFMFLSRRSVVVCAKSARQAPVNIHVKSQSVIIICTVGTIKEDVKTL
jgi:hypothetical protein